MKLFGNNLKYTEQISRCILDCIERFAPVTEIKTKENPIDWITNTDKNAFTNRYQLFQNWTKSPSEKKNKKYQKTTYRGYIINTKCQKTAISENWDPIHRAAPFTKT